MNEVLVGSVLITAGAALLISFFSGAAASGVDGDPIGSNRWWRWFFIFALAISMFIGSMAIILAGMALIAKPG